MYFRSRKKLQGEVSLNDSLDSDADGESLYLMDVVGVEDTMYLDIQDRDDCLRVRRLVHECLTEREEEVIISRYGLGGRMPHTQREVAKKLGISRSYVSRIEKRALEKLEQAEHFIFLEFFIIAQGQIWDRMEEIFRRVLALCSFSETSKNSACMVGAVA